MRIGELAAQTGVNIETIRYYEGEGILPKPMRAANNCRMYSKAHLRRLCFVRRARDLGFTLDEGRLILNSTSVSHRLWRCECVREDALSARWESAREFVTAQKLNVTASL